MNHFNTVSVTVNDNLLIEMHRVISEFIQIREISRLTFEAFGDNHVSEQKYTINLRSCSDTNDLIQIVEHFHRVLVLDNVKTIDITPA